MLYTCVGHADVTTHVWLPGQVARTTCRSWFSRPMWVPTTELRSLGWAAAMFTYWAISPAPHSAFKGHRAHPWVTTEILKCLMHLNKILSFPRPINNHPIICMCTWVEHSLPSLELTCGVMAMSKGTDDPRPQRVDSLELGTASGKGRVSPLDVTQALTCSPHSLPEDGSGMDV